MMMVVVAHTLEFCVGKTIVLAMQSKGVHQMSSIELQAYHHKYVFESCYNQIWRYFRSW